MKHIALKLVWLFWQNYEIFGVELLNIIQTIQKPTIGDGEV